MLILLPAVAVVLWVILALSGYLLRGVVARVASAVTALEIDVGSVSLGLTGSLTVEDVTAKHLSAHRGAAMFTARKVRIGLSPLSFIRFRPRVASITIADFVLEARYDGGLGRWNLADLAFDTSAKGGGLPAVALNNGRFRVTRQDGDEMKVFLDVEAEGRIQPAARPGQWTFRMAGSGPGSAGTALSGIWSDGLFHLDGSVRLAADREAPPDLEVREIGMDLRYEPNLDYKLVIDARGLGFTHSAGIDLAGLVEISQLGGIGGVKALDRFFANYRPRGTVDIELHAEGNLGAIGQTRAAGMISCRDVSIRAVKFPYLVEHINGSIDFTHDAITLNSLAGRHGDVELVFSGWLRDFGPERSYQVNLDSDNMVLDEDLYAALGPRRRRLWRIFKPSSGAVAINHSIARKRGGPGRTSLAVRLLGVDADYQAIPGGMRGLTGRVDFLGDRIVVTDVVSHIDGSQIVINGQIAACDTENPVVNLSVRGGPVQIGQAGILDLLGESSRDIIASLRPVGEMDFDAVVRGGNLERPELTATVRLLGASARPRWFSYPFTGITGKVLLRPGSVELDGVTIDFGTGRGCQANPCIAVGGVLETAGGGIVGGGLYLNAREIPFDRNIIGALPKGMSELCARLEPAGLFSLDLPLIGITSTGRGITNMKWEGNMAFETLSVASGVVKLSGSADTVGLYRYDSGLAEASVLLKDGHGEFYGKWLDNMRASMHYDAHGQKWVAEDMVAGLYGGRVSGTMEYGGLGDSAGQYVVDMGFEDVDLRDFLMAGSGGDMTADRYHGGIVSGQLSATGRLAESSPRVGQCSVLIERMRIGRSSAMAKFLSVLKLTEPRDYIFDRMSVEAYINRDRLFLRNLAIYGNNLAFEGSGSIDLSNRTIEATLYARGPRLAATGPTLLGSLAEGLGGAVVRMELTGDIKDPDVTITRFPVLKDSLEVLGSP